MNDLNRPFFTIMFLILFCSCAIKKPTYRANNSKRTIIIENDSILRYTELIGCFGNSNTLNFTKENEILKVSGNTDTKQEGIFGLATDLYGSELRVERDSLVIQGTGEVFYVEKFVKSRERNKFQEFYIILNGKKQKSQNPILKGF